MSSRSPKVTLFCFIADVRCNVQFVMRVLSYYIIEMGRNYARCARYLFMQLRQSMGRAIRGVGGICIQYYNSLTEYLRRKEYGCVPAPLYNHNIRYKTRV